VWRWDQAEPFGANPANDDPDGNQVAFDLPLRLPGQRYDKETGLHYNYFRDYDPSLGRYVESDPVGLLPMGEATPTTALNHPFAYVASAPLIYVDVEGLYKYAYPWVPPVTNPQMDKFLLCLDLCTGQEQTLTATTNGRHQDPGHANGTSVDVRPTGTPSKKFFCCTGNCGSPYVLDERTRKSKYWDGPHYHIQLVPPSNPTNNATPPSCRPC